jgi:hypothetical protein
MVWDVATVNDDYRVFSVAGCQFAVLSSQLPVLVVSGEKLRAAI